MSSSQTLTKWADNTVAGEKRIINLDDLDFREWGRGERFAAKMGEIGRPLGASKLGYNLTVVPPGKRAFPMHCHHVNEEMFFVLAGMGEIRIGDERYPIREGDVICCPAGGKDTAHQIINTMPEGELKYLAVSTSESPEICQYPDSGKSLVHHYLPAGGDELRYIFRDEDGEVGYWKDEE